MKRRVVITGIGMVGPCGSGREALWQAAQEGKSGISLKQDTDAPTLPIHAAGFMRDFQPAKIVTNRKSLKVMCRDIQMAVVASILAKQDAGLTDAEIKPTRSGVCIGAGIFEHDAEELSDSFRAALTENATFDARKFGAEGMGLLFPLWLLKYLPNMPACHITITHNLQGPSNTLTGESGGTASAIEESIRIIQRGTADLMFCGGAESRLYDQGLLRYHFRGVLKNGAEKNISYPVFSSQASGMVMGEGGTILILEELEHALERKAPIYAEIKGFFMSADGLRRKKSTNDLRENQGKICESQTRTIKSALAASEISTEDVDAIHLSARGILLEDTAEAETVRTIFGNQKTKPTLVLTKGLTGFLGYAAAPTELALAGMSLREHSQVPSLVAGEPFLKGEFNVSAAQSPEAPQLQTILVNHFEEGFANHSFVLGAVGGAS